MNVLIACEESQEVCKAFRDRGANAFSCDLKECSGGHPEWHVVHDAVDLIYNRHSLVTQDGRGYYISEWDLLICHPPCTFLTATGNRWFDISRYGDSAKQRYKDRYKAIVFFMYFVNAPVKRVVIENPVGIMSTAFRKPDQIIQPYYFGDPYEKRTCLWLKGVEPLIFTNVVVTEPRVYFDSGKSMPAWYAQCWGKRGAAAIRSKTFPGIAKAMAEQWYMED